MTAQPQLARLPWDGGGSAAPAGRSKSPAEAAGRLLAGYSIEITGSDRAVAEACDAGLPVGTEVFIAFVPGESHDRVVDAARQVGRKGLTPVPHIVARAFENEAMLDRLLGRFADEGGVRSALVIAGDRAQPDGPFHASVQLVETGLFEKHGITQLAFALHPESHPRVDDATLRDALTAKLAAARAHGLQTRLVSQFSLDAAPILPRLIATAGEAPATGVRIGVAGPTSAKTLWKYALYCGIGNSLKALHSHGETLAHLSRDNHPEKILGEIAMALERNAVPAAPVQGVHIFTFGGVAKSVAWADQLVADARAQR